MRIIKINFNYTARNVFTKLYKYLVRPHLEYEALRAVSVVTLRYLSLRKEIEKRRDEPINKNQHLELPSYKTRMIKVNFRSLKYGNTRGD